MQNSKNPPAGQWPEDVDALRAGLEHARKHRARCEAGAREALDNWIEAETALAHGGKMLKHGTIETVGPGRVDHLWRLYSGEQDGAEHAAAVVVHVGQLLERAERAAARASGGESVPAEVGHQLRVVLFTRAQVERLIETIGERCDRLHAERVALPESAEGRAAGMLDSLTFWQDIEKRLKASDCDTLDTAETVREVLAKLHQVATAARNNSRPPGERLQTIHELARDAANHLRGVNVVTP
jgi:hypothetical protein